ncbi:methyltransferase family protein [Roseovarius phycicola]|uniref:Methanethiol S-methyltransferase n=1 Tax=Roseovarius phycicola TaxID=3080976 RepID=A0ABZ2HC56_9RHOB
MRLLAMAYSLICYFFAVTVLVALILFIEGLFLPVTINQPSPLSPQLPLVPAVVANVILVALWGLQHSVMADARFKAWWTQFVHPAVERSTFLLVTTVSTAGLMALWSPIPITIWDTSGTPLALVLCAGYFFGWAVLLFATFLINHFHLFGLEQAYRFLSESQSKKATFVTPFLYRIVRHPMMTGILISLWCVPHMTVGRLVFNLAMTAYILVGTRHEEDTLVAELGEEYEAYRRSTPMLLPRFKARKPKGPVAVG